MARVTPFPEAEPDKGTVKLPPVLLTFTVPPVALAVKFRLKGREKETGTVFDSQMSPPELVASSVPVIVGIRLLLEPIA